MESLVDSNFCQSWNQSWNHCVFSRKPLYFKRFQGWNQVGIKLESGLESSWNQVGIKLESLGDSNCFFFVFFVFVFFFVFFLFVFFSSSSSSSLRPIFRNHVYVPLSLRDLRVHAPLCGLVATIGSVSDAGVRTIVWPRSRDRLWIREAASKGHVKL